MAEADVRMTRRPRPPLPPKPKGKKKRGDKDGAGAGIAAVSDTDCGAGFIYNSANSASTCAGTTCDISGTVGVEFSGEVAPGTEVSGGLSATAGVEGEASDDAKEGEELRAASDRRIVRSARQCSALNPTCLRRCLLFRVRTSEVLAGVLAGVM